MKMKEVIDRVSELYRENGGRIELRDELLSVERKIREVHDTKGEYITVAEFKYLENRYKELKTEIALKESYYDGIFAVRELLMDLGFDTEVK